MKITSDENVNQAVEQMVQAIRNTDAYLEYQKRVPSTIPAGMKAQPKIKGTLWWFPTDLGSLDGKELETALRKEITNQKKIGFEYIWLVNACNHFVVK